MTIIDLYKQLFGRKGIQDGNVIDMAEHGRAGGISSGDAFKTTRGVDEKLIIDDASSTTSYFGKARMGGDKAEAVWQIKRINTVGTETTFGYAGGVNSYTNIWNSRTGLSYS